MKNPLFINKKKWNTFSDSEMEHYREEVFSYFRKNGFPYFPTDTSWRQKEYNKLKKYDYTKCIDLKNKVIKQTMHGLSLCWSYFPHHYEVSCNDMMTVKDAFEDDDILRGVIRKRTIMGDNMSDNGLRKMIKIYTGVQCVSNFRPTAAAAIYHQFGNGGLVYDMSSGFGGRLLGSHLVEGQEYYGVDPATKTHDGLLDMINDLNINARVDKQGSEERTALADNSVDLCFTSPPYFDCEKYSDEPTQSYKKYPNKNAWVNGFMRDTLLECLRVSKNNAKIAINIQNVRSYPTLVDDVIELANSIGLISDDVWGLQLSSLKGGYKTEPILIFKK